MTNKTVKPLSNAAIGAALVQTFQDEFNTSGVKAVVTGTGDVRAAKISIGETAANANVLVGEAQELSVVIADAKLTTREWAKLTRTAHAEAQKTHAKVVNEFITTKKKAAKKAAAKKKIEDAKAKKKAAERVKADKKKAAEAAKAAKKSAKKTTAKDSKKIKPVSTAALPFPGA